MNQVARSIHTHVSDAGRSVTIGKHHSPDDMPASILGAPYRDYREQWARAESLNDCLDWPLHLDVDTNYSCNLVCIMCPLGSKKHHLSYPDTRLDIDLYRRVIEEGAGSGLAAVRLGITGEPLLRPDILDFIRIAVDAGLLDIMLITNGLLLDPGVSRQLIDSGLTRLMVSLDAHTPATYARIRRSREFERVRSNVLEFLRLRNQLGRCLPLVRVSFVRMNLNIHEEHDFRLFWEDKADYISFQAYSNIMESEETAYYPPDRTVHTEFKCPEPFTRMSLFVNGDLFPCCSDFGRLAPLGNAARNPVADIWRSDKAVRLRAIHAAGCFQDDPVCLRCARASMGVDHRFFNTCSYPDRNVR
jgi:uncharacterized Fe-S cluster-containing radical SAM superfamily protein